MDWFRMYGEMMDDPKIGTLTDSAFRTWVELLCCACKAEDEGNTKLTEETLNWALRRNVTEAFQQLFQRGLVTVNKQKEIVINKWAERQKKSDSSADRVRKHREKAKLDNGSEACNVTETVTERDGNALEKRREEKNKNTCSSFDDRFAEFWKTYPRKVGKKPALKAYQKLKPDEALHAKILAAISVAKASQAWLKDGGQYIPHPASWLNAERWEDELQPEVVANDGFYVPPGKKLMPGIGFVDAAEAQS